MNWTLGLLRDPLSQLTLGRKIDFNLKVLQIVRKLSLVSGNIQAEHESSLHKFNIGCRYFRNAFIAIVSLLFAQKHNAKHVWSFVKMYKTRVETNYHKPSPFYLQIDLQGIREWRENASSLCWNAYTYNQCIPDISTLCRPSTCLCRYWMVPCFFWSELMRLNNCRASLHINIKEILQKLV